MFFLIWDPQTLTSFKVRSPSPFSSDPSCQLILTHPLETVELLGVLEGTSDSHKRSYQPYQLPSLFRPLDSTELPSVSLGPSKTGTYYRNHDCALQYPDVSQIFVGQVVVRTKVVTWVGNVIFSRSSVKKRRETSSMGLIRDYLLCFPSFLKVDLERIVTIDVETFSPVLFVDST